MHSSTVRTACWTILSSNAAIPNGRCRPSSLGIQVRLDGCCSRYAPRWIESADRRSARLKESLGVLSPRHAVDARSGVLLQIEEARLEQLGGEMVQQIVEPHRLVALCRLSYAQQPTRLGFPALSPGPVATAPAFSLRISSLPSHGLRRSRLHGPAGSLFARFSGTTKLSDFPEACMSALWHRAFSDRSSSFERDASGISRFP